MKKIYALFICTILMIAVATAAVIEMPVQPAIAHMGVQILGGGVPDDAGPDPNEVIRYIDTAVSGGAGDGKTWEDAYASCTAWEAAEQTDLVTAGKWHHVYATGGEDSADCTIDDWTTGASNYILFEAASGDEAVKTGIDTDNYYLSGLVSLKADHLRMEGIQLSRTTGPGFYIRSIFSGSDIRIQNCYIKSAANSNAGIDMQDEHANLSVFNTIIVGFYDGILNNAGDMTIYQCVINSYSDGIELNDTATATVKNSAVFDNSDDFDIAGTATLTADYVASDDGDGTNSVAPSGADWSNEFTTPASNFTVSNSGNLYQGGVALGAGLSVDIDGDSWSSPPTIGADEY